MAERPSAPWPFWASSSGLILSCFILFLALTIARLCQGDFQDAGFVSERVVCRVETASGRAWHAGVARACLCVVKIALGQGPTVTRSGGGSGFVTWSVCSAWRLGSTVVRRQLLHLSLPSVGLPNYSLSSGLLQTLVPPVNAAAT